MSKSLFIKKSLLIGLSTLVCLPVTRACVCSIDNSFNLGAPANTPTGPGGLFWTEYTFLSQSKNWSGTSSAPAENNPHKLNRTNWVTPGFQYFFNDQWGFSATLPFGNRLHIHEHHDHGDQAEMGESHMSQKKAVNWWGLGDMRVNAYYTGFSPDMSTGLNLGLQLPTGDWQQPGIGRNKQLGTGSVDILTGFYHRGKILGHQDWNWFVTGQLDAPVITQGGYRPGLEVDASTGIYYTGIKFGKLHLRPIAQVIFGNQASDSGPAADSANSGFQQLALSPGLEINYHPFRVYGNVAFPVMSNVVGNQLIAPCTSQVVVSIAF